MEELKQFPLIKFVWCIFDGSDLERPPRLILIVDDEDKAIQFRRNNPELVIEIEQWVVK